MSSRNEFGWVGFYREFARILLGYRDDRKALIRKIKQVYERTGIHLPTLGRGSRIEDIDPFTVFGLFNKSSMKKSNRIRILEEIAALFGVSEPVPGSFESIPVLNNQNATFYSFAGGREKEDIEYLWSLFACALRYADDPSPENRAAVSEYFDLVIHRRGNGNSKVTMGLYWIAPDTFLNLDSRNEWYIYESGRIPPSVAASLPAIRAKIPAATYFEITEKMRSYLKSGRSALHDFRELSFAAWTYSEEVNNALRQDGVSARGDRGSALADEDVEEVHYWLYAPGDGAARWEEFYERGVMGLGWSGIGDLSGYASKDEMKAAMKESFGASRSYKNAALATWQFANEIKPGDVIFVKKGMHYLVGRGIVESGYVYDPVSDPEYPNIRRVKWTDSGEWDHPGRAVMKTLTDITPYTEYVESLCALFESDLEEEEDEEPEKEYPPYGREKFLEEVYMMPAQYDTLVSLLRARKNVILQGAPGVGKTFAAKRLAYSMLGRKDQDKVQMIQFHQSYTYEDFIEGFRPSGSGQGFEIRKGSFYNFCRKAADDLDNEYFFIIDEINRGNLSRIFGELFMLIEADKRGNPLQLLYSDEKFFVPKNVYIIGMMNTADRSLALLDYALRRRFVFFDMKPAFGTDGFEAYRTSLNSPVFDRLVACTERLNEAIASDESLGEGFCIGHSFFCNLSEATDQALSGIVEYELIPLLKEYWFDEPDRVRGWADNLRRSIR